MSGGGKQAAHEPPADDPMDDDDDDDDDSDDLEGLFDVNPGRLDDPPKRKEVGAGLPTLGSARPTKTEIALRMMSGGSAGLMMQMALPFLAPPTVSRARDDV